jgi:phosphatidylglycerophosphate synthase
LFALAAASAWIAAGLGWPQAFLAQSLGLYAAIAVLVLTKIARHHTHARFGAANGVTLGRAAIVCLLAGMIGHPTWLSQLGWWPAILVLAVVSMDGVDGWLSRRYSTASRFGARFDMETDALTILILSVLLFESGKVGGWVLLVGLMRYLLWAAATVLPILSTLLPTSRRRQAICVLQYGALGIALVPLVSPQIGSFLAAAGLILLVISFATDLGWLQRHAAQRDQEQGVTS